MVLEGGCLPNIHYPLVTYCHHQNDSYIKVGSNVSHFQVSLIARSKDTKMVSINQTFW